VRLFRSVSVYALAKLKGDSRKPGESPIFVKGGHMVSQAQFEAVFNMALGFLKIEIYPGISVLFISVLLFVVTFGAYMINLFLSIRD